MSRGHGVVQRLILDSIANGVRDPFNTRNRVVVPLYPLSFIAKANDYDAHRTSVRQSFGRAAWRLHTDGLIGYVLLSVPTAYRGFRGTNWRDTVMVCAAGYDPTEHDGELARFMASWVYGSYFDKEVWEIWKQRLAASAANWSR